MSGPRGFIVWRSICCIVFCLVSGLSHAKPVEQTYVDQATALFGEGNYSAALEQFQSLLDSSDDEELRVRLQWNVARCLEMLGRYEEALSEFYAYQSIIKDAQRRSRALRKIDELLPRVQPTQDRLRRGSGFSGTTQTHIIPQEGGAIWSLAVSAAAPRA